MAVRLFGLGFGLPYAYSRVDETAVAGAAVSFLSGDLTPTDFLYPTGFLYAVTGVYVLWYAITKPFGLYASLAAFADSRYQTVAPFFYLSRGLSAVMGVLTIWWVFAICRRVFDDTVAIVAALFTALAYLHVRDSHFGTTDVTMTALVVLTVLAIVRWQQQPDPWRIAVAGLVGGLAASSKYNGFGVWAPFAAAAVQRMTDGPAGVAAKLRGFIVVLAIFAAAFAVGFFGGSPYIIVRWHDFVRDLTVQRVTLAQGRGLVLSRGWWYHATITLPAALGWPMYVASVVGLVMLLSRHARRSAAVLAFPLAYYLVAGSGYRVYSRDMIPMVPFLCITAAWATVAFVRTVAGRWGPIPLAAATTAAALAVAAPSARNDILLDRVLRRPDNRLVVARALPTLIPSGSRVYQSGGDYGRVPLVFAGASFAIDDVDFDESTGRFGPDGRLPDWILLQRSPLVVYSYVPDILQRIVREHYELASGFPSGSDDPTRVYDQQDALFLPLSGLDGVDRIGPSFEIYRRRER